MKGPSSDKLLAAHILLKRADQYLLVEEAVVTQSLNPLWHPDFIHSEQETSATFVGLLQTASIYALDQDEAWPALTSEAPELLEFPPLPFKRVWIELHDENDYPGAFAAFSCPKHPDGDCDDPDLVMMGVGLIEVEEGRVWDVLFPYTYIPKDERDWDAALNPSNFGVTGYRITPQGMTTDDREKFIDYIHQVGTEMANEELGKEIEEAGGNIALSGERGILSLAITVAHLINANGVPVREVAVPRPTRRRLQRELKWGASMDVQPKVYFVDLKAAGEVRTHEHGDGTREYHCRWLVRGHWRQLPDKRVWVRPYVKGPTGAPWRGRPVYRT